MDRFSYMISHVNAEYTYKCACVHVQCTCLLSLSLSLEEDYLSCNSDELYAMQRVNTVVVNDPVLM